MTTASRSSPPTSSSSPPQPDSSSDPQQKAPTWSTTQYLKFAAERNRPIADLLHYLIPLITSPKPRIYDLGCGPGNSTQALLDTWPDARITGVDSSAEMLSKARQTLPSISFMEADLNSWWADEDRQGAGEEEGGEKEKVAEVDLLFSNATFHWLRHKQRTALLQRLMGRLGKRGVLAFQVPDNYHEPSHELMRSVATSSAFPPAPWAPYFAHTCIGNVSRPARPDLDPVESPNAFYALLTEAGAESVHVWRTEYMHVLDGAGAIVEWVQGTGLMPFLECIDGRGGVGTGKGGKEDREEREEAKKAFLAEYERAVGEVEKYKLRDGKVLLGYPRLFVVAVKG